MKLIGTLELVGITLHHQETVLLPFEQLRFIQVLKVTSSEVSLHLDQHIGAPLNTAAKSCCLLLICVCVDYQAEPEPVDLLHGIQVLTSSNKFKLRIIPKIIAKTEATASN